MFFPKHSNILPNQSRDFSSQDSPNQGPEVIHANIYFEYQLSPPISILNPNAHAAWAAVAILADHAPDPKCLLPMRYNGGLE